MIHYSCDRCKRVLDSQQDLRYTLRIEIEAVMDPINEEELEIAREILRRMTGDGLPSRGGREP